MPLPSSIRAGHLARQLIEQEGLHAQQVDIVPGAAGGPKGIGATRARSSYFWRVFCPNALNAVQLSVLPLAVGALPVF